MDLLASLNPEQRLAASQVSGPLRIIAGAGTGKTKTITHRMANQIAEGIVAPHELLAITFTDHAATQLRQRIASLGISGPIRATTIHAAAWAQVRYFWSYLSDQPVPSVLTSPMRLIAPLARRFQLDAADLAGAIDWALNQAVDLTTLADQPLPLALSPQTLAAALSAYGQAKTEHGVVDYHDMLRYALALADTPAIDEIRGRYRAITVDEFQDTNAAQWRLIQAWDGGRGDLCVVGDPNQAIFGFTGASPTFLDELVTSYPAASTVVLTRSYRASRPLVAFANQLVDRTSALVAVEDREGPEPKRFIYPDGDAERDGLVGRIKRMVDRGLAPHDVAILLRLNTQIPEWEQALWAHNLPVSTPGQQGFYAMPQVGAYINALRGAYQQAVEIEARRAPIPGVVEPVHSEADHLATLATMMAKGCKWASSDPLPIDEAGQQRWHHLAALASHGEALIRSGLSFVQTLATLEARVAQASDPAGLGGVQVMTLHKAKGDEFRVVIMPACEEGLLPISHATSPEARTEEARLFYVGVTRAQDLLVLSSARQRPHPVTGKNMDRTFTPFIPATSPLATHAIPG